MVRQFKIIKRLFEFRNGIQRHCELDNCLFFIYVGVSEIDKRNTVARDWSTPAPSIGFLTDKHFTVVTHDDCSVGSLAGEQVILKV